jgi:hypothetical protein
MLGLGTSFDMGGQHGILFWWLFILPLWIIKQKLRRVKNTTKVLRVVV